MPRLLLALLLLLPLPALAATVTLPVPDQGWQVSFDGPALRTLEENDVPGQYMYVGNAGRFNLSLYVEDPGCNGGDTHEAWYNCFWPKASRNPMIVRPTVQVTPGKAFYKISYTIEATLGGRTLRQRNVNFLFAYRGKWVDLHVSVVEPEAADLKMLERLEQSLRYGPAT